MIRKVGNVLLTLVAVLGAIYIILITFTAKSYGDLPARNDDDIAY